MAGTPIDDKVGLAPAQRAELEGLVDAQGMLHEVIAWMAQSGADLISVTDQDEFTNDLVLRWREGLYLVYDCT